MKVTISSLSSQIANNTAAIAEMRIRSGEERRPVRSANADAAPHGSTMRPNMGRTNANSNQTARYGNGSRAGAGIGVPLLQMTLLWPT